MSVRVRVEQLGTTRRIFMKFDISLFCQSGPRKFKVSSKSDKNKGHFT
jgi:hypothetical protein